LPDAAPPDPVGEHVFHELAGLGVCAGSAPDAVELSFQLMDGETPILPYDTLSGGADPVSALALPAAFGLGAPDDVSLPDGTHLRLTPEANDGPSVDVPVTPTDVTFAWKGGEIHRHEERLLILMVDQSASMAGIGADGAVDVTQASDPLDQRIQVLRRVVESVPGEWWLSLVSFNGRFATLSVEFATPTLNRLALTNPGSLVPDEDGLGKLELGESGATPLADALDDVLTRIVDARSNANLNAQVLIVTDGVEDADPSSNNLAAVTEAYAQHMRGDRPAPVPVTVLQVSRSPLAPGAGRRMAGLGELACRTGGEYVFLRDQRALGALAEPVAAARLASRLVGTWRLTGASDLSGVSPGAYLATTRLRASLGAASQSFAFDAPADADPVVDTRGFVIKR
jgi:hypothetical protein